MFSRVATSPGRRCVAVAASRVASAIGEQQQRQRQQLQMMTAVAFATTRRRSLHHSASTLSQSPGDKATHDDILVVTRNVETGVVTLRMNDPKKLNAWTQAMMARMRDTLQSLASDNDVKVVVMTGTDPYYCAGVDLSSLIRPMHPKRLHHLVETLNAALFNLFIDFPKPIVIAANGPMIGACVTSATLCDAIVASEKATFLTPFAARCLPAEGCSSVHFARLMGDVNAQRMLGPEGWRPTADEALRAGLITEVVPHDKLMTRATEVAAAFASEGRQRWLIANGQVDEYRSINAAESKRLADAVLSAGFIRGQAEFLASRKKHLPAVVFKCLYLTRPAWSLLL